MTSIREAAEKVRQEHNFDQALVFVYNVVFYKNGRKVLTHEFDRGQHNRISGLPTWPSDVCKSMMERVVELSYILGDLDRKFERIGPHTVRLTIDGADDAEVWPEIRRVSRPFKSGLLNRRFETAGYALAEYSPQEAAEYREITHPGQEMKCLEEVEDAAFRAGWHPFLNQTPKEQKQ